MQKMILSLILCLGVLCSWQSSRAQMIPPADYGELSILVASSLGLDFDAANPESAVDVLAAMGISQEAYAQMFEDDGFGPWLPGQELTPEFLCKLKVTAWAAAQAGNVPGQTSGSSFVALILGLAQRDAECDNPPQADTSGGATGGCYELVWHWECERICPGADLAPQCHCREVCRKVWEKVECN